MNLRTSSSMNTNEDLTDALRWQLRALRRDEPPQHDLWAGIAARLASQSAARSPRRWRVPIAAAASVLLAIGVAVLWQRGAIPPSAPVDTLVQREAEGMTLQYQAALQELAPTQASAPMQSTVEALDRDVALIHDALARDPDSRLLLEQLRRTYAHRLALAQRIAHGLA